MTTRKRKSGQGKPPSGLSRRTINLSALDELSLRFVNAQGAVLFHLEFIRTQDAPKATVSAFDASGEMSHAFVLFGLDA